MAMAVTWEMVKALHIFTQLRIYVSRAMMSFEWWRNLIHVHVHVVAVLTPFTRAFGTEE